MYAYELTKWQSRFPTHIQKTCSIPCFSNLGTKKVPFLCYSSCNNSRLTCPGQQCFPFPDTPKNTQAAQSLLVLVFFISQKNLGLFHCSLIRLSIHQIFTEHLLCIRQALLQILKQQRSKETRSLTLTVKHSSGVKQTKEQKMNKVSSKINTPFKEIRQDRFLERAYQQKESTLA